MENKNMSSEDILDQLSEYSLRQFDGEELSQEEDQELITLYEFCIEHEIEIPFGITI
jgi:hypothetical protein